MNPVLRATAVLGSSSILSVLVGLVSTKAWAVLLGPSGLGLLEARPTTGQSEHGRPPSGQSTA